MLYKGNKVTISRGMTEKNVLQIPAWEIPVLKQVHGSSSVAVGDAVNIEKKEVTANMEYGRLGSKYGGDKKSGIPFVEKIYGTDEDEKLSAEIKKATVKTKKATVRKAETIAETTAEDTTEE